MSWAFTSSTGQGFTHDSIVDAHFKACQPAYLRSLKRVGIQPGWRVLDAGCGSGAFLPWLAQLAGPSGRVHGVDLAPEHVALASERARFLAVPIEIREGDLLALPYPDASFDALWCANAVQYLSDEDLSRALAEMVRVVRPGGLVAVKELDVGLITMRPGPRFLVSDFFRAAGTKPGYAEQLLRAPDLHRWLAGAGLTAVRQHTELVEHFGPLSDVAKAFYAPTCAALARQAAGLEVDVDAWSAFADPDHTANPLNDPAAYVSEGLTLAIGTRP
ncbi:methyltransferase domain-containing protein [Phytohabitans flavus]|uniref:Ubiquinone biosynthesis protein UbiE n=1 Tax=Phytohabitans flavus TaxID=1076124 RepID=A0A6F8XN08_9ACTN|nr:class I SAM-dependent methyltransferase [Phytohabitans flavus]BCB75187.1 ubiquinone biosynthesis protein UbiE [Phytohabitans flavus]